MKKNENKQNNQEIQNVPLAVCDVELKIQFSRNVHIRMIVQTLITLCFSFIALAPALYKYKFTNLAMSAVGTVIYMFIMMMFIFKENLFREGWTKYFFIGLNALGLAFIILGIAAREYTAATWICCNFCIALTYLMLLIFTYIFTTELKFLWCFLAAEGVNLLIFVITISVRGVALSYIPTFFGYNMGLDISEMVVTWILTSCITAYVCCANWYMLNQVSPRQNAADPFFSMTVFNFFFVYIAQYKNEERALEEKEKAKFDDVQKAPTSYQQV